MPDHYCPDCGEVEGRLQVRQRLLPRLRRRDPTRQREDRMLLHDLGGTARPMTTATDQLTRALLDIAARGQRTHCSDPGTSELWISDRSREAPESAQAA